MTTLQWILFVAGLSVTVSIAAAVTWARIMTLASRPCARCAARSQFPPLEVIRCVPVQREQVARFKRGEDLSTMAIPLRRAQQPELVS